MDTLRSGFRPKEHTHEPTDLFGYNEPDGIFDQVCFNLENGTSVQIVGERNAGKSSMLHCIAKRFRETRPHHLPVYLEFHGTGVRDPIAAYRHVIARVHATFVARSNNPEELPFGRLRLCASPDDAVHFTALQAIDEYEMLSSTQGYFRQLNDRGLGVVLLFDEYEFLMREVLQLQVEKFWELRRVVETPRQHDAPSPLTIVLAGAHEWSDFCCRYGSPTLNIVTACRVLPPLARDAFHKMWLHCCAQCGSDARSRLDRSGVSIDKVYDLTGGWAYAGKMVGQHVIGTNDLNEEQLAYDFGQHFKVLWKQEHRTDDERAQLLAVARGDTVPLDALRDLRQRGLVEDDGRGNARLRGTLWRQWVRAQTECSPAPTNADAVPSNMFRRDDDGVYHVRYQGGEVQKFPKPSLGFHYIAEILNRPNPQSYIGAMELERVAPRCDTVRSTNDAEYAPNSHVHTVQETLDKRYLEEVRERLDALTNRIEEIQALGFEEKEGELDACLREKEQIMDVLRKSQGLGGRVRTLDSSPEEDACDRVRHVLTYAYKKIDKQLPALAQHLKDAIDNKSASFTYQPTSPTEWA